MKLFHLLTRRFEFCSSTYQCASWTPGSVGLYYPRIFNLNSFASPAQSIPLQIRGSCSNYSTAVWRSSKLQAERRHQPSPTSLSRQIQPATRPVLHSTPNNKMAFNPTLTTTAQQDWEKRPPYRPVEGDEVPFEKKLEGSCHCGRVKYWLRRDRPLVSKYCHCRGCQVLHGAPFQWAAIFNKEDMLFENGVEDLIFYQSGTKFLGHDLPCKLSCAYCRTPIMDEGRRMCLLFPTLLHFGNKAERDLFYPDCHIFYSQRVVDIPDGKPKYEALDGKGNVLLDDLP